MVAGKSICRTCSKEFKWYRNIEQGPAKYCSKLCKDTNPEWRKVSKKKTIHICIECGKSYKRYIESTRYCSRECMNKNVHTWNHEGKFRVEQASEEEHMNQLKIKFESHVIKKEGCWSWSGTLHKSGYAVIQHKGVQWQAHRASWILFNGELPCFTDVLHKCDNRQCTNPEHLFLGTQKDNVQDMIEKNRDRLIGEKNANKCLQKKDVVEIRHLLSLGVTCSNLARKYGVSYSCISFIKHNRSWKSEDVV